MCVHREDKDAMFVVMEFAELGDLFEVMRVRKSPFAESEARWLFKQLLSATDHLHKKKIAFRDHSLENVLMYIDHESHCVVPKITDPGQAIRFNLDKFHRVKEIPTGASAFLVNFFIMKSC